jgi:RNA polymerase sigma factor (sigma-70 family)
MPRLGERHASVRGIPERNLLVTQNCRLSYFSSKRWAGQFGLDLEDARAECNLVLIRAAELWRSEGGKTFAGYAVMAMYNQLVNCSKKERRRGTARLIEDCWEWQADPKQRDPAEIVVDRAELTRLRDAIARLDPRPRKVMEARAAGETSHRIAEGMGVSRQRVEQIEQTARERLRELLHAS